MSSAEVDDFVMFQLPVHRRRSGDRMQELRAPCREVLSEDVLVGVPDVIHVRLEVFDEECIFTVHIDLRLSFG